MCGKFVDESDAFTIERFNIVDELFLELEEINLSIYVLILILELNLTELRLIFLDSQMN